eukprot:3065953-Alexandrium_andersonii.AAC.1
MSQLHRAEFTTSVLYRDRVVNSAWCSGGMYALQMCLEYGTRWVPSECGGLPRGAHVPAIKAMAALRSTARALEA